MSRRQPSEAPVSAGRRAGIVGAALALAALTGCRQDMHDQPKIEPLEQNDFYADGRGARPIPEGTISRAAVIDDEERMTGKSSGEFMTEFPAPVTKASLERGQERYEVFCTPCHGGSGDGSGMVVKRGFPQPASFHSDRLRQSPPGYIFDVITNGFGRMQGYSAQLRPDDRWAVVAYIRALQLSQNATEADVPAPERARLAQAPAP